MATCSDNGFVAITEEMTLEALQTYLSLRNKSSKGDFETVVNSLVLFFLSTKIFWSTWNSSMNILLTFFIYETIASIA